ncbi:MAG: sugar phosphate isomerase/epimerase [Armatimonadota bacterium]|nr:MAG: sugar phosphate isomerase/epimerase [Armatimonadota bacterium]
MAWKYAVFTVMCPERDLEQTAALASSLGLDGLEWRVTKKAPEPITEVSYWGANRSTVDIDDVSSDLARAKEIADRHDLAMPILGTYMKCHEFDVVEAAMRAAAAVGCPKLRVGPPGYDGSRPYQDLFDQAFRDFTKVAELASGYGVQACIEMHMGNITPSAGLAHRLVSHFDPAQIGVIFDPGNMVVEGFESYQMALELLGPYLSHVHAKNCVWAKTGDKDGVAQWEWRMAPVNQGQADWTAIVAALRKVGYHGWLSFEDFSEGDTEKKLSNALSYLKSLEASA